MYHQYHPKTNLIKFHISGVMKLCVVVAPQKRVVSQSLYLVHKYKHKYKYKCKHELSPFSQAGYFLHQSNVLHICSPKQIVRLENTPFQQVLLKCLPTWQ